MLVKGDRVVVLDNVLDGSVFVALVYRDGVGAFVFADSAGNRTIDLCDDNEGTRWVRSTDINSCEACALRVAAAL